MTNTVRMMLLVPLLLAVGTQESVSGDLIINVSGIDPYRQGNIRAGLYSSRKGYLQPGYEVAAIAIDIDGAADVSGLFRDLPPGNYVIAVVHDENGNGNMDRGFLGIPKEGYGFGGVGSAVLVPPAFDSAAIYVGSDDYKIAEVHMKYF